MKFVTICLLFSLFLVACRKERINPDEVRILKTTVDGPNGSKINTNFEYDNQGKITRITRNINNDPSKLVATVTYNGNEVTLFDNSDSEGASTILKTIKFVLDNERKPLSRIQIETWQLVDPAYEQQNFITDTTYYEYNAAGLLTQTRELRRDSVWFFQYAHGLVTRLDLRSITRTFQSLNGNIKAVTGIGTRFDRQVNNLGTFSKNYILEESVSLDYTSGFKNQADFKNAFILAEYGGNNFVSVVSPYLWQMPVFSILNPSAKNIPNRRVGSSTLRDDSGALVSHLSDSANYRIFYTNYGFLSGVTTQNSQTPDLVFTYNK